MSDDGLRALELTLDKYLPKSIRNRNAVLEDMTVGVFKWFRQQKGEKMPTFEPTIKEIIAEMYKRFGHLLGAREIDEFAHDFGRNPAASEERGLTTHRDALVTEILRVDKFKSHYIIANTPGWEVLVDMAQRALQEKIAPALQSVPSSPWPNKIGSAVLSPQIIREAVERVRQQIAAAPSDAGQPTPHFSDCACLECFERRFPAPALEKLRGLEAKWMTEFHKLSATHYGGEGERIANIFRVCAGEVKSVLDGLEPKAPPRTCQKEQE